MGELVVLGGSLLASPESSLLPGWGIWIEDGRIADLGPNSALRDEHPSAQVIDARHLLLMPGFINAHMHAYGLLAHGIPAHDVPPGFYEFLSDFWWPRVEDRLDEAMIEASMDLACYRMIQSGITTFCDVLEAPNAPEGILDIEANAVRRAGLRAILMTEASERIDTACGKRLLAENARFIEAHRQDDHISGMLCVHTSFTCSESFVLQARRMMEDLNCDLHLHLSESDYEPATCLEEHGIRPVMWYDNLGLWSPSVLASQAVAVDEEEIRLLAKRGVRVAHMPLSNCEVGGGVAPVPDMIDNGIRPSIGSDGYINDPFEVMRGAFLIHKGVRRNPLAMSAKTVLSMATTWGAKAVGFPQVGAITPGRQADIIGIDFDLDTPL
ncbi:amidohydrolase family protein, partial [Candidatus Bipolaricaulota bacterium]|nr:amidohydrolase family protein [Candidatus Bipolaricaulota bacterium]